jgi:pyruvate dehydrogenase E2 component (dihydrolipoamide acetyltransferase)
MTEGELLTWHCKVGDVVKAGDVVCEVATDKIDMEVEATASGTVTELRGNIGDVIEVGVPLIMVEAETDDLLAGIFDSPAPAAAEASAAVETAATPTTEVASAPVAAAPQTPPATAAATIINDTVLATPKARAVAAESNVDLHYVSGTGRDGVIKHGDVLNAAATASNPNRTIENRIKARNAIAKALAGSIDIPCFSITFETAAPASLPKAELDRVAFLSVAWANTLRRFPELHANWNDGNLVSFPEVKVAISVMAPAGVVTPTITIPTDMTGDFLDGLRAVITNAQAGKIALENLTSSTTGFVDLGNSNIVSSTGILIRPQSISVAFSSPASDTLRFTINADHRISDPADVELIAKALMSELKK